MIRSSKQFEKWKNSDAVHDEDAIKWLSELHFAYWNDLIYYIDNLNKHKCLCLSVCFKKKIFELIYD